MLITLKLWLRGWRKGGGGGVGRESCEGRTQVVDFQVNDNPVRKMPGM